MEQPKSSPNPLHDSPKDPQPAPKRLYTDNFFSKFFFHFAAKVIRRGNRKSFELSDLYRIEDSLLFSNLYSRFEAFWRAHPSFTYEKAFAMWVLKHNYLMIVGQLTLNLLTLFNPFFIKFLINWFLNPNDAVYKGYIYSMVLFLVSFQRPFINQHSMKMSYLTIIHINAIVLGTYFKKFQSISMSASRYINIGVITTSITSDSIKIIIFTMTFANLIVGPVMTIALLILIIIEIGWAGIIGILSILVFLVVQIVIGRRMEAIAKEKSVFLDQRNRQVSTALTGIKTIKFSNWESIVLGVIEKIRRAEVALAMRSTFIRGLLESIAFIMPLMASFISIWIYQARNGLLSVGSIFYVISVFNMTNGPIRIFFFAAITYIEAKVGLMRIGKFCKFPDQNPEDDVLRNDQDLPLGHVSVRNVTVSFENEELREKVQISFGKPPMGMPDKEKPKPKEKRSSLKNSPPKPTEAPFPKPTDPEAEAKAKAEARAKAVIFRGLSLELKAGQFVAVIGKVGSGKTSFLKTLLGGLFFEEGQVRKNGRIAYIPQESFLINGLLKDNILFGSPLDEEKYKQVIKMCELEPDLKVLPGGDLTEIGERGINLSGGQKQRIAIARAVYAGADIFLIDDSLSAVDTHVGQRLFRNVFKKNLAGKTIVLVTHALQYLSDVDRIIMFEKGSIVADGVYEDLILINHKFNEFVKEVEQEHKKSSMVPDVVPQKPDQPKQEKPQEDDSEDKEKEKAAEGQPEKDANLQEKGKLVKAEKRFEGQVGLALYFKYFQKGGFFFFLVCLFFFSVGIAGRILADWWVGSWSARTYPYLSFTQSLLIYFSIALVTFVILLIRSVLWGAYMAKIAFQLFKDLIERIMGKKMIFFDTTPLGQILNLTSKDTDLVDVNIPPTFLNFLSNILQVIGTFVLVSVANIILIPVIVFILILDIIVLRRYLTVSMELRRLEQMAYSPILSNIIELFNGLPIFRSFDKTSFQEKVYTDNINRLLAISWHDRVITLYTNFLTEIMVALLIGVTLFLICIGKQYEFSFVVGNPSFVALTISSVLSIPLLLQFMMFMFAETAKGMSSVQRMMFNIDKSNMERQKGTVQPPDDWPSKGEIRAVNVSARYRPKLPLVVKNLTFSILPCEKIGIVGRTGSGKSTTILLLTRLLEAENEEEGFFMIDGLKVHQIDLEKLRSNLKVIPQDPFILKGSLRLNIDPFNKFSDERVIEALKKALLWNSGFFENKLALKKGASDAENKALVAQQSKEAQQKLPVGEETNKNGQLNNLLAQKQENADYKIVISKDEPDFLEIADEVLAPENEMILLDQLAEEENKPNTNTNEQKVLLDEQNKEDRKIPFPFLESDGQAKNRPISSNSRKKEQNDEIARNKKSSESKHNCLLVENEADQNRKKLDFEIEDGGKNLSVGEKQLVCIARALLDVPKILLMDEATSNIDQFTDLQIQEVIKKEFRNTTIITIAHRLNTIIQYDRIFVMEKGRLVEQGSPYELLTSETVFRGMVRENGPEYEEKLLRLAENKDLSVLEEFSQDFREV